MQLQGEEAEQLEGSDEKIEESCRVSAKVRFLDDIEDMGERSDLTAIQVIPAYMYCVVLYSRTVLHCFVFCYFLYFILFYVYCIVLFFFISILVYHLQVVYFPILYFVFTFYC